MALIVPTHRQRVVKGRDVYGVPIRAVPGESITEFMTLMGQQTLQAVEALGLNINETEADCLTRGEFYEAAQAFAHYGIAIYTGCENPASTLPIIVIAMKQRSVNNEEYRDNSHIFSELVTGSDRVRTAPLLVEKLAKMITDITEHDKLPAQWVKIYE